MREVAAEFERPALLFCGGKDSIVLLRLAEKAFRPGRVPVPAHARRHRPQLPRGARVPRPPRRRAGRAPDRRLRAGVDRQGPRARGDRAARVAQPAADRRRCSTRSRSTASTPRSAARAATRSAPARRSACFSFRDDFGQWDPRAQRPELWNLYNGRIRRGEHVRVFPISNWTELDVWHYIAREELELPSIYFAHEREVFERDGMLYAVSEYVELLDGEAPFTRVGPLPHGRRHDVHRRGALGGRDARRRDRRDRRHADHRARRDARRRPLLPRPRWKTASARATSDGATSLAVRLATAGSVDDGKSTLIGRLLYDTKALLADQLAHVEQTSAPARHGASTSRCSPTACAPSASRASRSTSPTATSRRRGASSSSPTRPGHPQYTRNMVTGASTADLAIILVDARDGLDRAVAPPRVRSPRCSASATCRRVNKMDLVDWAEARVRRARRASSATSRAARPPRRRVHPDLRAARRQRRRPLASTCRGTAARRCSSTSSRARSDGRRRRPGGLPRAVRDPRPSYRGYAGQVAGGRAAPRRRGGRAAVGRAAAIAAIEGPDGGREARRAAVGRRALADDLDVGRGD